MSSSHFAVQVSLFKVHLYRPLCHRLVRMAALYTETKTLSETATDAEIVKRLGELGRSIASQFCCGSTLSSPEQVNLVYQSSDGFPSLLFPGVELTAMQQLMSVCSVASFGVGCKEVTDLSYRNALKLQPDRFLTSFQLSDTPILGEIQKLMMPDMRGSIRAELYKLNIYSGPGGHFKAHVDTPRSSQMFGSLVVCLPTQFRGGALVTRHQGREVRFDWSSSPQKPMQKVSWAAFFSDVEHEVLPVTDGYRLTLTYNLYWDKLQDVTPTANITNSPFYHDLCAAVSNPHFLRDGGVLGFSCQHHYVFQDLNCDLADLPCLLKGADNIVYMTGISLGLPVIVKPVTNEMYVIFSGKRQDREMRYILPKFSKLFVGPSRAYEFYDKLFKDTFGEVYSDERITWCQELTNFQPAATYTTYGNELSCDVVYQAAAILVGVPKWGKRQILEVKPQQAASRESSVFGGPDMEDLLRYEEEKEEEEEEWGMRRVS